MLQQEEKEYCLQYGLHWNGSHSVSHLCQVQFVHQNITANANRTQRSLWARDSILFELKHEIDINTI
jgi:hypothetical protein